MGVLEAATAVEKIDDSHWRGEIVPGWRIGAVSNGGYVLALAGRVLREALSHPDPLTLHIMYLAPTELGQVDCEVEILRTGGSTSYATLLMRQGGEIRAQVSASYTDLGRLRGESWSSVQRPQIAPVQECTLVAEHGIELRQNVDQRYFSGGEVFKRGKPDGSGCFSGWLNLADGSDPGVLGLLLFADAMAPPIFTVYGPLHWVPTIELSVQVRAHPAPGPIQVRFQSRYMTDGIVEEDGELWDSTGRLVALSRQTSKVRVLPS
jgi:acyl-CoA thioesterase